jgi:hypothetical protein
MARAFDQIYAELGSAFDPSAQLVQQQIDAIPGSTEALVKQADAKKDQGYEDILNGMRRRGMGFSGITGEEQAKYNALEYAPAIANVKSQAEGRRVSLLESLNSLGRDRRVQAQGIYDNELARDLQERQFQEQIRQFNAQQKAAERAAAAAAGGGGYSFGGGGGGGAPSGGGKSDPFASVNKQSAANSVLGMLKSGNQTRIANEIAAISKSASYGNIFDKFKLELLKQYQGNSAYGNLIANATKKVSVVPAKSGNVTIAKPQSGRVTIR